MATRRRSNRPLIERVLARATLHDGFPRYWTGVGVTSATALVREAFGSSARAPRPGYATDLPATTYNGYAGHWVLTNNAGKYELRFYQTSSF